MKARVGLGTTACVVLIVIIVAGLAAALSSKTLAVAGAAIYYLGLAMSHVLQGDHHVAYYSLILHLSAPALAVVVFFTGFFVESSGCADVLVPTTSVLLSLVTFAAAAFIALLIEVFVLSRHQMEH